MNTEKNKNLSKSSTFNLRAMRWMNGIAIALFVFALIYKFYFAK